MPRPVFLFTANVVAKKVVHISAGTGAERNGDQPASPAYFGHDGTRNHFRFDHHGTRVFKSPEVLEQSKGLVGRLADRSQASTPAALAWNQPKVALNIFPALKGEDFQED